MPKKKELSIDSCNALLSNVRIISRGEKLYLRGTFPTKPQDGVGRKRYDISTQLRNDQEGLRIALLRAQRIEADLNLQKFRWADWIDIPVEGEVLVKNAIAGFKIFYFNKKTATKSRQEEWHNTYERFLKNLPENEKLTGDLLRDYLLRHPSDSYYRGRCHMVYSALARWAEIKLPKDWPYFKGDYQSENIDKEPLSDEEILKVRKKLEGRRKTNHNSYYGWLWIFGMMATYGLRPHEVFSAELFLEDGVYLCRIPDNTKTGKRLAFPLSPNGCDWVKEWNLDEKWLPNIQLEGRTNKQLGAKVSAYFYSLELEISPYELRHAYARRGIVGKGIDSVYLVASMGHSIATHLKYYGRYLNQVSLAKIGKYALFQNLE